MAEKKWAVIGAGISGLSVAYYLKQQGNQVQVYDSRSEPGGCIATHYEHGYMVEVGPNSFQGSAVDLIQLTDALGMRDAVIEQQSGTRYIFCEGRLCKLPAGPVSFFGSSLLDMRTKLKLLSEPFRRSKSPAQDESFADFVRRKGGPDLLRNLAGPFVSGIYAGDPEKLSAAAAFPKLVKLEKEYGSILRGLKKSRKENPPPDTGIKRSALCSFKDGMQSLPNVLQKVLGDALHLNHTVNTIQKNDQENYQLHIQSPSGDIQVDADALVIALPNRAAATLTESLSVNLSQALDSIRTVGICSLFIAYKKEHVPVDIDGFGFLIPREENIDLLGCIWSSYLFPGRAPEDEIGMTCFIGGSFNSSILEQDDQAIIAQVQHDLKTTMHIEADPTFARLTRYDTIFPQYELGHLDRVATIRKAQNALPNLHVIGNYLNGISVSDCIRQARELVENI